MDKTFVEVRSAPATELLESVKRSLHERSRTEGEIIEVGVLRSDENAALWNADGISLDKRLQTGEVVAEEAVAASGVLAEYFVPTTAGARKRCIDGSSGEGYDDNDPRLFGAPLGPQIQGGTLGEAVAIRMAKGFPEDVTRLTVVDDINSLPHVRSSVFAEGAHDDDRTRAEDYSVKTGCGQFDGQTRKQPRYADELAASQFRGVADAVLVDFAGIAPPEGAFETLRRSAAQLASRPDYFSAPANALAAVRRHNHGGIETVIRPHNEITLTINLVPDTTFHRDHYDARTDSRIQNFNMDAWAALREHGDVAGYALIVDAAATFMDLTDGSLRVLIRRPRQDA